MRESIIEWLMEGDPAVRWQTMRDLLGRPQEVYEEERGRIPYKGWGQQFIEALEPNGGWPQGRWTGSVWTLQTLVDLGFPADHPPVQRAAKRFMENHLTQERADDTQRLGKQTDLCHLAFWLRIGCYFRFDSIRLMQVAHFILDMQMDDGGWNCRRRMVPTTRHSSFHTTFNVLDGLLAAKSAGLIEHDVFASSQGRAIEFMLAHSMYRSDKTGLVVSDRFTHLTYPTYWHYTVLRGLDAIRNSQDMRDPRLDDPISLIRSRQGEDGFWPVEKRIPGATIFEMERMGFPSRWNTLRCLRVLEGRDATKQHMSSISAEN